MAQIISPAAPAPDTGAQPPGIPDRGKPPAGVQERTLGLLELLADHARGMQIYEIAERLHIPRSATHRLLTSLVEQGYVQQERDHGAYRLTARLVSLAFRFLSGSGITDLAQPLLDRLAAQAGELVRVAIIDGTDMTWVAKAQGSPHGLRYDPESGQVARLSCSASGIAWLASLSDDEAVARVERQGYGARADYGPNAPETRAELLALLDRARRAGYADTVQTYYTWMSAMAAAIRSPVTEAVIGTLVIAGPSMRMTDEKRAALVPDLLQTAQELSHVILASPALARTRGAGTNFFRPPPA